MDTPLNRKKTMVLFGYDWDGIEFRKLVKAWPQLHAGFDLFKFPSNARLAYFDMERFVALSAYRAKWRGAGAVVSNHEQFGALTAALLAERMGWPGTSVEAVLACQHKLYAREVLQRVAPEANIPFERLDAAYNDDIPAGIGYPIFVKPVKAAFSVLAKPVASRQELRAHTRFGFRELWVIKHLVEPFERIIQKRLPEAGTAHSLMLEQCVRGRQYCLDGYCFEGRVRPLGIVDAIMYPGTDAFMRWDYPSALTEPLKQEAERIAATFLNAIGFEHGFFNMEFIVDEQSGQLKVIEFNPRMAAQFSDLYARVDGLNLHEMALAMSQGVDPTVLPKQAPAASCAASFVYRSFDPMGTIKMPGAAQLQAFKTAFPDALLLQFPRLSSQIERDWKWLGSYRYGIMHLGGKSSDDLRRRCEAASAMLGWPAPYAAHLANVPGLGDDEAFWPSAAETEKASS